MSTLEAERLYLEEETVDNLYYYHEGALYDARTLLRSNRSSTNTQLVEVINLDAEVTAPEEFESRPLFVKTQNGWTILIATDEIEDDDIKYVQSFDPDTEEDLTQNPFRDDNGNPVNDPIIALTFFRIPKYYDMPEGDIEQLPEESTEPFHQGWLNWLIKLRNMGRSFGEYEPYETEISSLQQSENLPISISTDELNEKFQTNDINTWFIDPNQQIFGDTPNIRMTLITRNEEIYSVRGRYNAQTNQLLPPINTY